MLNAFYDFKNSDFNKDYVYNYKIILILTEAIEIMKSKAIGINEN